MKLKNIFIISAVLMFCLVNPAFAYSGSGTLWITSTSSLDEIIGDSGSSTATQKISYIDVNNVDVIGPIYRIVLVVPNDDFYGSDKPSDWDTVTYKIGAVTIGTGTAGWSSDADNHHIIYFFDSCDFSAFAGAQVITVTGAPVMGVSQGDSHEAGNVYADPASADPAWAELNRHSSTWHLRAGSGGNLHSYVYSSYSHQFPYTYSGSLASSLYLNLTKDAVLSNVTVENDGGVTVLYEPDYTAYDIDLYDWDFDNATWTVTVENSYGRNTSVELVLLGDAEPIGDSTIEWNEESYLEGATGSYDYSISDEIWNGNTYYSIKARLYKDPAGSNVFITQNNIGLLQSATQYVSLEDIGIYQIELVGFDTGLDTVGTVLDSDTVIVGSPTDSFISSNDSVIHPGIAFNLSYLLGFEPDIFTDSINAKWLDESGNWVTDDAWFFVTIDNEPNILHTHPFKIFREGDYIFEIYQSGTGRVAHTPIIKSIITDQTPTLNVTYSNISIGKTVYYLGERAYGDYQVDNANYSNYTIYLQVYNIEDDFVTTQSLLLDQADSISRLIKGFDYEGYSTDRETLSVKVIGNHKLRLAGVIGNSSVILAESNNFSVSKTDINGYGLIILDTSVCVNELIDVQIISPTTGYLRIYRESALIRTYPFNGSWDLTEKFIVPGLYHFSLFSEDDLYFSQNRDVVVSSCKAEEYIPPDDQADTIYNNLLDFFMLPIFWGMIIWIGVSGSLFQRSKDSQKSAAVISFLFLQLLIVIGMFAPFTLYIAVSSWIIMGIFFYVGRQMTMGD